ncbi:hypothetical protein TSAR_003368 [Trichomalopsis sarcophagae]|uniref:DNA-directed DNA polymerase n=1 Tax=Trichomalopsis sarcophagae TaxID=543379 RepID=A0A232ED92_9HYME|nr:hypothetical protein TSAR_003368 [Trichomalopsis sarcophagae]
MLYLVEYERDEDIVLDCEKIKKNPGLPAVAKLCLNSQWGKFGQRTNMKQTTVVKSRKNLLKLLFTTDKEVFDILPINDDILYVNWQFREDVTSRPYTNVVIAGYTTAQARLELYGYLEKLGSCLLYCNTDSCIFVKNKNDPSKYEPPIGNLLGAMTDGLRSYGEGTYIETKTSAAPKFYAFRTITPDTGATIECCKVKRIRLNYNNSLKINFDSIKSLIDDEFGENAGKSDNDTIKDKRTIKVHFSTIRRILTHEVVTSNKFKTADNGNRRNKTGGRLFVFVSNKHGYSLEASIHMHHIRPNDVWKNRIRKTVSR